MLVLRCLAAGSFREIVELIEISENANAFGRREFAQLLKRLLAALVQGFHPSLWHGQRNIWHRSPPVISREQFYHNLTSLRGASGASDQIDVLASPRLSFCQALDKKASL